MEGATSQLAHSAWPLGERGNCWMPMSSRRPWLAISRHWPAVTSQIKPDQARSSPGGLIHYQLQTAIFCLRLNPSISQQIYWANLGRKTNGYCTLSYTKGRLFHEKLSALNGIMVFLGELSPNGPTFQVNDIIIYPDCSTMMKVIIDRYSHLVLVILWWILNTYYLQIYTLTQLHYVRIFVDMTAKICTVYDVIFIKTIGYVTEC